jgi:hypothetical protein
MSLAVRRLFLFVDEDLPRAGIHAPNRAASLGPLPRVDLDVAAARASNPFRSIMVAFHRLGIPELYRNAFLVKTLEVNLFVEETSPRMSVDHSAYEAQFRHGALQLIGRSLRRRAGAATTGSFSSEPNARVLPGDFFAFLRVRFAKKNC